MTRRRYNQYCSLARALDVVGERWTLLVVRELMLGPRRFGDLLENLPGIGRNLLAERLRHLEAEGIVARRTLPPPAASRVYELTEHGWGLGPAMTELSRWGVQRLGEPQPDEVFRPAWAMFPLSYMADTSAARGIRETYEFHIDDQLFHIRVDDGEVTPASGPADRADVVFTMTGSTILDLLANMLDPVEALTTGLVRFEGPQEAVQHALAVLAGPPPEPVNADVS